jgi:hypothetical protein
MDTVERIVNICVDEAFKKTCDEYKIITGDLYPEQELNLTKIKSQLSNLISEFISQNQQN